MYQQTLRPNQKKTIKNNTISTVEEDAIRLQAKVIKPGLQTSTEYKMSNS